MIKGASGQLAATSFYWLRSRKVQFFTRPFSAAIQFWKPFGTGGARLLLSVARGTRLEFRSVWFVGVSDKMDTKVAGTGSRVRQVEDFRLSALRHPSRSWELDAKKTPKCGTFCANMSTNLHSIYRSWNALQLWFWMRVDRSTRLTANGRKRSAILRRFRTLRAIYSRTLHPIKFDSKDFW